MRWLIVFLPTFLFAITEAEIYNIAKQFTNYPSTIVAIAKAESSLGKEILGDDGKSLGLMQLQVPTVRWIATKDKRIEWLKDLPTKSLQTLLLRSDTISIMVTCIHFEYWRKRYGYYCAVSKHNGGMHNQTYYDRIQKRMK
jgi:hypothetical protein